MKVIQFALFFILIHHVIQAQVTPESIVQRNLDAYNARDIDQFMSVIHPDVQVVEWNTLIPVAHGFDGVKKLYQNLFEKSPDLHSTVINRTIFNNKVIDYEFITGRMGEAKVVELVVMYEVENQLIKKILVIRK